MEQWWSVIEGGKQKYPEKSLYHFCVNVCVFARVCVRVWVYACDWVRVRVRAYVCV